MRRIASDTGGTFTDLVLDDGTIAKVPSTPADPGEAVRVGVARLVPGDEPVVLAHGTTVATNALLERRGARVALVTNEGFADVIEIARQDRPSLYDQSVDRPTPVVPRRWRYEVRGRLNADGSELVPLDLTTLPAIDPAVDAVAICLLHSDRNPAHELAVKAALEARGLDVTASCDLSPEFREYERTATVAVNAYVRPVCRRYLRSLAAAAADVLAMTSAGGLVPAIEAAEQPARLMLSGPAGGVLAGAALAAANGHPDAITFDMGGTSTDVCLVRGGRPKPAAERDVAGFPVRLPSLDVHTIGAGGGSIARVDEGGALVVGPESAGAVPGPACYGHGGVDATVTDANVVAGHIPADRSFPGIGPLDGAASVPALDSAGVRAADVLAVVNTNMELALRRVSVERGVDPRGLALVAFGGAGPLHACALAEALGIPAVIIPPRAGVFSAVGILGAPRQVDLVESWRHPQDHAGVDQVVARLVRSATDRLRNGAATDRLRNDSATDRLRDDLGEAEVSVAFDCRYAGQSHELSVLRIEDFPAEHERRNGYARPDAPIELIAVRATARVASPVSMVNLPPVVRDPVVGPAVVAEDDCTIWVPEGWRGSPGVGGALVLERAS